MFDRQATECRAHKHNAGEAKYISLFSQNIKLQLLTYGIKKCFLSNLLYSSVFCCRVSIFYSNHSHFFTCVTLEGHHQPISSGHDWINLSPNSATNVWRSLLAIRKKYTPVTFIDIVARGRFSRPLHNSISHVEKPQWHYSSVRPRIKRAPFQINGCDWLGLVSGLMEIFLNRKGGGASVFTRSLICPVSRLMLTVS